MRPGPLRICYTLSTLALLLGLHWPTGRAGAEPKAIDPLRVMSFNIRYGTADDGANAWTQRGPKLLEMLRQRELDILGLQECLAFQLKAVQGNLEGFDSYALGRDKDGGGEMCALLWRRERFDLLDSGTLPLHPDATVGIAAWDAALPRICSWVQLYDKLNQRSLWVYNAHLDHMGEKARLESAKLILKAIAERDDVNGTPMPVLLLGDLNCKPDSAPLKLLRATLQDCHALGSSSYNARGERIPMDESSSGTFHDWTGLAGDKRIDYILSSLDFSVLSSEVVRESWVVGSGKQVSRHYPSDHFPVMAELALQ
jgi:endonuclease/exonuclease/phosphatase family metal-dependent hydrolase